MTSSIGWDASSANSRKRSAGSSKQSVAKLCLPTRLALTASADTNIADLTDYYEWERRLPDDEEIELYENRIKVPHKGSRANWLGEVEHFFESGPVVASVQRAGGLYLEVEGVGFASLVQCRPEDEAKVREFALKINNASDSIHAMLEARERAVAQARRKLETTRSDRASIDAATAKLEAAKGDTGRVDAARSRVAEALPTPTITTSSEE